MAGDAAIQIAMLDIAADFLRANEPDFHLIIIHGGDIRAAAEETLKPALAIFSMVASCRLPFGRPNFNFLLIRMPKSAKFYAKREVRRRG